MMLDFLGEEKWGKRIENAVITVLKEGMHQTPDPGRNSTTYDATEAIKDALRGAQESACCTMASELKTRPPR